MQAHLQAEWVIVLEESSKAEKASGSLTSKRKLSDHDEETFPLFLAAHCIYAIISYSMIISVKRISLNTKEIFNWFDIG